MFSIEISGADFASGHLWCVIVAQVQSDKIFFFMRIISIVCTVHVLNSSHLGMF